MDLVNKIRKQFFSYGLVVALVAAPVVLMANPVTGGDKPVEGKSTCTTATVAAEEQQEPVKGEVKKQSTTQKKTEQAKPEQKKQSSAEESSSYSFSFLQYLFSKFDMDNLVGTDLLQDALDNAIDYFWE